MAQANIIEFPQPETATVKVRDGYNNFAAQIGINTDNISSFGTYSFDFLTRNRILLEAMYRGSWIIGAAIDHCADDMTQEGVEIESDMEPKQVAQLTEAWDDLQLWESTASVIKWSRLYGSSVGVYLIDGQDMATPLNLDTVGKGQFKGVLPMDRWQLVPSIGNLIKDFGPDMGLPEYYRALPDSIVPDLGVIHHTRLFRMDSIELPHYQKLTENLWAESIIERIYDRIEAFDSTTQGAAQLVFKAYLRVMKVEQLRDLISTGGAQGATALQKQIQFIRRFQSTEGITLLDAKDDMQFHSYTFAGLDNILLKFGEQISGAIEEPMIRLFGQTPGGMNATGEFDLRNYYQTIRKKQNTKLRRPVKTMFALVSRSIFGKPLPDGFNFKFNPLWQVTDAEQSDMAQKETGAICGAVTDGVVTRATALKELKQGSKKTGMWSNITDEDIADAESEPPLSEFTQTPEEAAALAATANGGDDNGSEAKPKAE